MKHLLPKLKGYVDTYRLAEHDLFFNRGVYAPAGHVSGFRDDILSSVQYVGLKIKISPPSRPTGHGGWTRNPLDYWPRPPACSIEDNKELWTFRNAPVQTQPGLSYR